MMTKEGSTNILNFITSGAGVLVLGHGHMSYKEKDFFLNKKNKHIFFCTPVKRSDKLNRVMMSRNVNFTTQGALFK